MGTVKFIVGKSMVYASIDCLTPSMKTNIESPEPGAICRLKVVVLPSPANWSTRN